MPAGSFFALLGPSGCGKTTTLRMVAGLEKPTDGRILIGDDDITGCGRTSARSTPSSRATRCSRTSTILENVAFGLRRRGTSGVLPQVAGDARAGPARPASRKRKPAQLSGGQQQRVALARALINRPELLLLDEPLGALDLKLRRQMQIELKRIQTEVGLTFVHVTHDQEEAMTMADTIAVMNEGRIEQMGAPAELYELPRPPSSPTSSASPTCSRARCRGRPGEETVVGVRRRVLIAFRRSRARHRAPLSVGVRPEKTAGRAGREPRAGLRNGIPGNVTDVSFTGLSTQYLVRTAWGQEISVFAQNAGGRAAARRWASRLVAWRPEHTFPLDAAAPTRRRSGARRRWRARA